MTLTTTTARSALARVATGALDLVYPRRCAGCGEPLATGDRSTFCGPCDAALPWIVPPICLRCGEPFEVVVPEDAARFAERVCAACRAHPPAYEVARAAFLFDGPIRKAIHALKFNGRREIAMPLAVLLHRHATGLEGFLAGIDAVVPLPLHPRRLRERGYNQAEALAAPFAALAGLPLERSLLIRSRETAPQVGLDRNARRANVQDAFAVSEPARAVGRSFMILDDVMTTGATLNSAAHAIRGVGATFVRVATVARG